MRLLFALGTVLALLVGITSWKVMEGSDAVEARSVNTNTGVVLLGLKEQPNPPNKLSSTPTPEKPNQAVVEDLPAPPPKKAITPPTPPKRDVRSTIRDGDSLYKILRGAYGKANETLVEAVAKANRLEDPSNLNVGKVLLLPEVPGFQTPQQP